MTKSTEPEPVPEAESSAPETEPAAADTQSVGADAQSAEQETEQAATDAEPAATGTEQPAPQAATAYENVPTVYDTLPTAPPSTRSVVSLVLGIIGLIFSFFFLGLLPAIAGVILGHLALKREPHARGMAVAGLVTGYVGIAISVLWAVVVLVPFVLLFFGVVAAGTWGSF